jgi:hypothetical protein
LVIVSSVLALLAGWLVLELFYQPEPVLSGWKSEFIAAQNNDLGYRGRPIDYAPDDRVVLLLGDSSVEGVGCGFERMPEARLEYHLGLAGRPARVFSVAASGYGQDQQLHGLREYLAKHRADVVVLWLTPSNDIWNNLFPTHWPADGYPKPTYWLEGDRLCGPTNRFDEPLAEPSSKLFLLTRRLHARRFGSGMDEAWEATLPPAYLPAASAGEPVSDAWEQLRATGKLKDENLANEKTHLALGLTPPSERMAYGIRLTRALLREIEHTVTSQGGQLRLLLVETPPAESGPPSDGVFRLDGRLYRHTRAQEQAHVRALTEGFQTMTIPVTVERWRRAPDDPHLNERATDQVMADLAGEVIRILR